MEHVVQYLAGQGMSNFAFALLIFGGLAFAAIRAKA